MNLLKTAVAAALFAASPAASAPAKPPAQAVITQPDWIAKPDAETVSRAYPVIASRLAIAGKAVISCQVDDLGKLQACRAIAEVPTGLGFGAAALSMARAFHMRPMTRNGEPVQGGTVRIPLRFKAWQELEPPAPKTTSGRKLEIAKRLLTLSNSDVGLKAQYESTIAKLEHAPRSGLSDEVRGVIVASLRESYPPRIAQVADRMAALYADAFTEAELTQIVAFESTSAGRALMRENADVRAMLTMINREHRRISLARTRESFCAKRYCSGTIDGLALVRDAGGPHPAVSIPAPIWLQQPSYAELESARPWLAKSLGIGGAARLTCTVASLGLLANCTVVDETPRGVGFGTAAHGLYALYRLSPSLLAKGAVGETVAVVVQFEPPAPDDSEPILGPPPRSPKAIALAQDLLAAEDNSAALRTSWLELMEQRRQQDHLAEVTKAEWDAAMAAMVAGGEAAEVSTRDLRAAYLATLLTDAELVTAIRFWRSPIGLVWKAKRLDVETAGVEVRRTLDNLAWADAGRAFCRLRDCESMVAPSPPAAP